MTTKLNPVITLVFGFLLLIIGAALGIGLFVLISPAPGAEENLLPKETNNQESTAVAQISDLQQEMEKLRAENKTLRQGRRREIEVAPQVPPAKPEPPTWLPTIITDEKYAAILKEMDWQAIGESFKDMAPLLAELFAAMEKGESPPLDLRLKIKTLNDKLITAAVQAHKGDLPGSGINGKFTHPLMISNQVQAVLKSAGLNLDKGQLASLEALTKLYSAKDASLRLAAANTDFSLETLLTEIGMKENCYNEIHSLLSAEQRALLGSAGVKGRLGIDLFSPGLVLTQFARPVPVEKPIDLVNTLVHRIKSKGKLSDPALKQVYDITKRWAAQLPKDVWDNKASKTEAQFMQLSRVKEAAAHQLELYREIINKVSLSPEDQRGLLQNMGIMVPLPK